jgi:hypothetical protein
MKQTKPEQVATTSTDDVKEAIRIGEKILADIERALKEQEEWEIKVGMAKKEATE